MLFSVYWKEVKNRKSSVPGGKFCNHGELVGGLLGVEFQVEQAVDGVQADQLPGLAVIHQQGVVINRAVEVLGEVVTGDRRAVARVIAAEHAEPVGVVVEAAELVYLLMLIR